jgi:hypothetical protein
LQVAAAEEMVMVQVVVLVAIALLHHNLLPHQHRLLQLVAEVLVQQVRADTALTELIQVWHL